MRTTLILLAILAALPLARRLAGRIEGWVGRIAPQAIGPGAPSRQPDHIHLSPAGAAWKDAAAADALARPLLAAGFQDAGTYEIQEMPVTMRLLVHPEDALCAAIHQHPRAGTWLDLVSRYRNGTSVTFTTSQSNRLDTRPGHPTVHSPGASPLALLSRARSERPRGALRPAVAEIVAGDFEEDYAESITWRRRLGAPAHAAAEIAEPEAA